MNVGASKTLEGRLTAVLYRMAHDPNVVTRWICAQIIANRLSNGRSL